MNLNKASQSVDVLLGEYQALKQESLLQIQLYHRQTSYIQLYSALLFGPVALFLAPVISLAIEKGQPVRPALQKSFSVATELPTALLLAILTIAAVLAFYFVGAIMHSSYMLLVLRKRMAEIERRVGELLEDDNLLVYERKTAPRFLEHSFYGEGIPAPQLLSGIWRVVLFTLLIAVLSTVGALILPTPLGFLYAGISVFFALLMVWEYGALYSKGRRELILEPDDKFVAPDPLINFARYPLGWLLNYTVILLLVAAYLHPDTTAAIIAQLAIPFGDASSESSLFGLLSGVWVYTLLCAVFLPTPSEAPLVLAPGVPLILVLVVSGLGKAVGSVILAGSILLFRESWETQQWYQRLRKSIVRVREKAWFRMFSGKSRRTAYFLLQALPFFPMRSSTVAFAATSEGKLWKELGFVGLAAGIATMIRMVLIYMSLGLGILALKSLIPIA